MPEVFFDTNVLLYLLSTDTAKAERAEALIARGGHINVQVLNEFASVALRKADLAHAEIRDMLGPIRSLCQVHALSEAVHDVGLELAEHHRLALYDAMIVAAALQANCSVLYSEDMQEGRVWAKRLRIVNPFRDGTSIPSA